MTNSNLQRSQATCGPRDDVGSGLRALSSVVARTRGRNDVAIRTHTLQKFEEVAARGKDKGRVFGDDGLVGLHRPCEFIERHRLGTLVSAAFASATPRIPNHQETEQTARLHR